MNNVCVFGASCSRIDSVYINSAILMGELLAREGIGLVFGGGSTGLMGAVAEGAHRGGGRITGVIPEKLNVPGIANKLCDKLIVTATMHERKAKMEELSDGFLALPGGFGTLEELLEVLTLNQLGYICAPIVVLNTDGFYDELMAQLAVCVKRGFTDAAYMSLLRIANTPEDALAALMDFRPPVLPNKIKEALRHYDKKT